MRIPVVRRIVLVVCVLLTSAPVIAQQVVPISTAVQTAPAAVPPKTAIPVKIDLVMMRFKGTEKIGSMPYSLLAVDGTRAMLRLGSSVPVPQSTLQQGGTSTTPVMTYSYSEVGVSIDINVTALGDGRYRLALQVEDSSLGESVAAAGGSTRLPVIRRYRIDTQVIVRDGQLTEFNVATDKVSGETIRAQVTMTVLK